MLFACEIRSALEHLPDRMWEKRAKLPARKGFRPGIRTAAKACGIAPTTYARIEDGGEPDLKTLIAILEWLEDDL